MTPDRLTPQLAAELSRQFDIIRLLGEGGMGSVWLARERSLDRLVAIKVLAGEGVTTSGMRERFRREARIAARLLHPNIVPLFAFGETADALYFAMGYVEGESLAARLDRDGRLPRAAAIRILSEISDALSFAHREGVVHRDVKPENILLDAKSGRAMLADFGIARLADAAGTTVTQAGMAVGTPSYMSPEQAIGASDVDGRADIYSLGVVGYRMLLGRLPFSGGAQQLMAQHATAKAADLTLAVAASERKLAEVIMCAIEKDPKARWARAEDLRDELQTLAREGSDLPEGLQRVEMLGTKFLLTDLIIIVIFYLSALWDPQWMSHFGSGQWEVWALLAGNLAFLPVAALAWAIPTIKKFGWRDTLRAMLHPPKSWVHWWPRALRRADDIWDRLPKPLRRLRNIIDGVAAFLILDISLFLVVATTGGGAYGDWFLSVMRDGNGLALQGAVRGLLPVVWVGYEFLRAKKKLGLTAHELTKLLGTPHLADDAGWVKPKFARLLGAQMETTTVRAPQSPEELVRSIRSLASRLVRSGFLPDDESARAAEAVRRAIEGLEGEIARLHQDLDPLESEKLDRRLAALTSSEEDAELRNLLEGQQAVLQRLERRRQEKEARRDRLRDQLVSLYMHLLELDGRLTRGAAADPELTGRVRALSSELGHLGEAMSEVDRLLMPQRTLEVTPT
ncbi:MAG: protein kinase [Gemmatimonadaceae bacterium]